MDPRACFCTHAQDAFGREEVGKGLTVLNVSGYFLMRWSKTGGGNGLGTRLDVGENGLFVASFPGRSRLQFLIAYCMQKRRRKAKESHVRDVR